MDIIFLDASLSVNAIGDGLSAWPFSIDLPDIDYCLDDATSNQMALFVDIFFSSIDL